MDLLRSCYKSSMRLYSDRLDVLTPGAWRFCPPLAKPLPFPHSFGSRTWDLWNVDWGGGVGEVPGRGAWLNGQTNPALLGQRPCGSAEVWRDGVPVSERGDLPVDDRGDPLCCRPSEGWPLGGFALGGSFARESPEGSEGRSFGGLVLGGLARGEHRIGREILTLGGLGFGGLARIEDEHGAELRTLGGLVFGGLALEPIMGPFPDSPQGVVASVGSGSVLLTWNDFHGAATFNVYYSSTSEDGPWTLFGNTASLSEIVTGLTNGTTYYFAVTGLSAGGAEGPYEETVSATPVADFLLDHFVGAAGAPLGAHVMNTGPGWTVTGNWQLDGAGDVHNLSMAGAHYYPVSDAGHSNFTARVTIQTATPSKCYAGLLFRWVDAANYWIAVLSTDPANPQWSLAKKVAGVLTVVGSVSSIGLLGGAAHLVQAVVSGSSIAVTVDGLHPLNVIDSALSTATKCGMDEYRDGGTYANENFYANFEVTP
jgi:hypothetical protein